MLQRRRLLILTIFLLTVAACLFAACDGSYINKDKLPLKPWQDYIADVSRAIDLQYICAASDSDGDELKRSR